MLRQALGIAFSIGFYLLAALGLAHVLAKQDLVQPDLAEQFAFPVYCRPEPIERALFLLGLLVLPAILLLWLIGTRNTAASRGWTVVLLEGLFAVALLAALQMVWRRESLEGGGFPYHLRANLFARHPRLGLALVLGFGFLVWRRLDRSRLVRGLFDLVVAGCVTCLCCCLILSERSEYSLCHHFAAVFYPVAEVCRGKTLLVDARSQYGLYPHFLQPALALLGPGVLSFTLILSLLTGLAFLAVWLLLRQTCHNRLVALFAFVALVFNAWFCYVLPTSLFDPPGIMDLFYQYFPIRFLFPALLLPLAWRYFQKPSRPLWAGITLLASLAPLWNADSGVPTLGAWLIACAAGCHDEAGRPSLRALLRLGRDAALSIAGVFLMAILFLRLHGGSWPDLRQHLLYQNLFMGQGFNMLPLPTVGIWWVPCLVYLCGLASAFSRLIAGREIARAQITLLLAVLGAGVFAYYQGRSHPFVLTLAWWPCFVLLALLLDDLVEALRAGRRQPLAWLSATLMLWWLAGSAVSLALFGAATRAGFQSQLAQAVEPAPSLLQEELALLDRDVGPDEPVLVIGDTDAALHIQDRHPVLASTSLSLTLLKQEYQDLCDRLHQQPRAAVLIERRILNLHPGPPFTLPSLLDEELRSGYEVQGVTGRHVLLRRGGCLLPPTAEDLIHQAFRDEALPPCYTLRPLPASEALTLEAIVRPAATQVRCACLVSNRPRTTSTEGLTIEQDGDRVGMYVAEVGDGRTRHCTPAFRMSADEWHHLAVVVVGGGMTVFVDGLVAATVPLPKGPMPPGDSPIWVGNRPEQGWPFAGTIREMRVTLRTLTDEEVRGHARAVRTALGLGRRQ
jgi:hypothetical protein